ncbi:phage antirepressor KilAC domain-containing protein [Pseudomonas sp. MAFF 301449]|uniref:Phage antirepressor KilAC domain-containing protein n=1 Tax=Pseudomonas cyclaminis TaxID=2781239 RepID=A0ABR9SPF3_9PSED|nr:phage antirepressor KilAC domain-containing protein [Pseudomonas cyclaminis]MBE8590748.1 phage antirepressor KilAC domain-containing protein [Pseudomonas cyclaminis]MBE8598691.1 phage antirepressor KilAC domain-containing protein [Pseudomonas cyclaminis]
MPIPQSVVNTNESAPRFSIAENVARTMPTIELREIINDARSLAGEAKVRNDQFLARVEDELGDELEGVQKYFTPHHGNQVATYDLTLDQCMLVGMRESKAVRRSVLKRLKAFEGPRVIATLPDFSNPAAAARAWAEQFDLHQQANQALIEAAPKIAFVDKYVKSTGLKGFRQTAKLLKANESRFRDFLLDKKIMYRMGGEWQAYQPHIDAGRFEVKTDTAENGHAFNQTKFTPKGVDWVAGLWDQYQLETRQ